MKKILQCPTCKKFTLKEKHCVATMSPLPPKYSPVDRYGKYRREVKEAERKQQGVL